jgi:HAD superfamily hydrolase (TIGR01509 family)
MTEGSLTPPFIPGAVIFDMDGLMLDTEGPVMLLWHQVAREMGWTIDTETALKTVGIDEASSRAVLEEVQGKDFPYDDIRVEVYRRLQAETEKKGIPHRPGLTVLLDHLTALGVPMGVATSATRVVAEWKLLHGGIRERFSILACGDEVRRGKPAPDVFLLAARRLNRAPEQCVGFEDSPAGLLGLSAAGIRSVFVKDLVDPPEAVLRTVWRRCADLAEAVSLFGPTPLHS